jgi:hypothetical protein
LGKTRPISPLADHVYKEEVSMTRYIPTALVAMSVLASAVLAVAPWQWG